MTSLFFQSPVLGDQHVLLGWNPSGDTRVTGYRVYYGTASHNYSDVMDVGSATNASIPTPLSGATYYFAITAYDLLGEQSDFSNEVFYHLPVSVMLTSITLPNGQFSFIVSGQAGATCVIQTSTNLVNWSSVLTNISPFTFVDSNIVGSRLRFYRTLCL